MTRNITVVRGLDVAGHVVARHEVPMTDVTKGKARIKAITKFIKKDKSVVKITWNGIEAWRKS